MTILHDLPAWLEKTIAGLGFELVDVNRPQGRGHIQIFIDKPEGITIDDCAFVSNHLTRLFAVENFDYDRLEISSPGLDRVLRKPEDFTRFAGQEIRIKLRSALEEMGNQKQFTALLKGFENDSVVIEFNGQELTLPLSKIEKARLVPKL